MFSERNPLWFFLILEENSNFGEEKKSRRGFSKSSKLIKNHLFNWFLGLHHTHKAQGVTPTRCFLNLKYSDSFPKESSKMIAWFLGNEEILWIEDSSLINKGSQVKISPMGVFIDSHVWKPISYVYLHINLGDWETKGGHADSC